MSNVLAMLGTAVGGNDPVLSGAGKAAMTMTQSGLMERKRIADQEKWDAYFRSLGLTPPGQPGNDEVVLKSDGTYSSKGTVPSSRLETPTGESAVTTPPKTPQQAPAAKKPGAIGEPPTSDTLASGGSSLSLPFSQEGSTSEILPRDMLTALAAYSGGGGSVAGIDPQTALGMMDLNTRNQRIASNLAANVLSNETARQKMIYDRETGSNIPMSWKEWNLYKDLPYDQKIAYLEMKRKQDWLDTGKGYERVLPFMAQSLAQSGMKRDEIIELGNKMNIDFSRFLPTETGTPAPSTTTSTSGTKVEKELPLEKEPEYLEKAEASKTKGRVEAEYTATERLQATDTLTTALKALDIVDTMVEAPGRETATGASRYLGAHLLPFTKAGSFEAQRKKLIGSQFMKAYETLKGGGQITEIEGEKATQAESVLSTPGLNDEVYLKALKDYRDVIETGARRLSERLSGLQTLQPGTKARNKQGQEVYFIGGDPKNPLNWESFTVR
jgi:hypothetical protein